MSLLFCDGFDYQSNPLKKWDGSTYAGNYNFYMTGATPRTGSGCMGFNTLWKTCAYTDTLIIGAAFFTNASASCGFALHDNSFGSLGWQTQQCGVNVNADGSLSAWRGNGGGTTLIGSTALGLARNLQWNYVEAKIVLSQTVGSIVVKLNGVTVLTITGVDTCGQSSAQANYWTVGASTYALMDDVYCCDTTGGFNDDFLGEIRVVTLLPQTDAVAAGSNADFTCSTGADHGALVNEASAPDDDTTYLSSSTLNHVDTWEYPALGYTGDIKAVQLNLSATKADSGARAIAGVTRPVATNRVGATNHNIGMTNYIVFREIWELNPEDSAAWEVADVDGAEFGVKVTV